MSNKTEHSRKKPARQGVEEDIAAPNKIGASTPAAAGGDHAGEVGIQHLVEETLTVKRVTAS